MAELEDEDK